MQRLAFLTSYVTYLQTEKLITREEAACLIGGNVITTSRLCVTNVNDRVNLTSQPIKMSSRVLSYSAYSCCN